MPCEMSSPGIKLKVLSFPSPLIKVFKSPIVSVCHCLHAGADVVLGMLPLARELLRGGAEVVLCANTLPAINDITAQELQDLLGKVASLCPIIKVGNKAIASETQPQRSATRTRYHQIADPWNKRLFRPAEKASVHSEIQQQYHSRILALPIAAQVWNQFHLNVLSNCNKLLQYT